MMQQTRSVKYIPGLDGLRAIAIIGVVLYHLYPGTVRGGFLGVSLFFVISGYLIAVTTEYAWETGVFSIGNFYWKRIRRLYPSLLIVILTVICFMTIFAPFTMRGIRTELLSLFGGFNNWWQITQNVSYFSRLMNASPFTHMWSLAVELQFYLIWPFLLFLYQIFRQRGRSWIGMLLFVGLTIASAAEMWMLYEPGTDPSRIYYGTDTRLFSLLMGATLGLSHCKKRPVHQAGKRGFCALFGLLMAASLLLFVFMDGQQPATYQWGMFFSSMLFTGMVAIAVDPRLPIGRILDCKPLHWIGKRSYEIYLWQYPVMFLFQKLYRNAVRPEWVLFQVALSVLLAMGLYHLRPILSFREMKKFMKSNHVHPLRKGMVVLLAATILTVSGCGIAQAPADKMTEDQKQLQEELKENQELLQQQKPVSTPVPPPVSTEGPAETPVPTPMPTSDGTETESPVSGDITAVGDSVMLGAVPALQETLPGCVIDATESRQVWDGLKVIKALDQNGQLGDTVIIGLGTNGIFKTSTAQDILDYLGPDRTVYWVTAYGKYLKWQADVNQLIFDLAEENENVHILDWAAAAPEHPEWFYDDGLHLNATGQTGYADFIAQGISQ